MVSQVFDRYNCLVRTILTGPSITIPFETGITNLNKVLLLMLFLTHIATLHPLYKKKNQRNSFFLGGATKTVQIHFMLPFPLHSSLDFSFAFYSIATLFCVSNGSEVSVTFTQQKQHQSIGTHSLIFTCGPSRCLNKTAEFNVSYVYLINFT